MYTKLIQTFNKRCMQQGYSENNFLINQQEEEYNFQDSVVLNPINLNPGLFNNGQPKTKNMISISKAALGSYEQFKLTKYMHKQLTEPTNIVNYLNIKNQDNKASSVIQVVNIDQISNVLEIGPKFSQLMKKYSTSDVCFATVIGEKGVGKSFFLDKILNLSDIRGNNFCQKQKPAIYAYPVPYMKDGIQIFLLQIGGCSLESEAFGLLNVISLALSSAYFVLTSYQKSESQKDWNLLQKALVNCISAFQGIQRYQRYRSQQRFQYSIPNLYYLSRRNQSKKLAADLVKDVSHFFKNTEVLNLPNAMTSNYKGRNEDLTTYSFLVKQCISPQYIKSVSQIFKTMYAHIEQKKIGDLILNGKIASKILELIIPSLNSQKNIWMEDICHQILQQLYISAYNYCVMLYHQELQTYFEDEQPKNLQEMYCVLERASNNALTKFKEFNLAASLSKKYEGKLIEHIQKKEELICRINKQKTKQYLQQQFNMKQIKSVQDVLPFLKNLRQNKKQLNDGRLQALKKTFTQLYLMVGGGTNVDNSLQRQLEQKSNKLESQIKQAKAQLSKKENANRKRIEEERMIQDKLRKEEQQVQKQYSKVKAVSQSEIDEDEIQKIIQELKVLQTNLQKIEDESNLPDIKLEIAEACKGNQAKLKQLTERQKQLIKEIEDLKNAKTATGQSKQKSKGNENEVSKMKSSEQKPKSNKKESKK